MTSKSSATAFAPATVANVGPGFDILGFAVEGCGDTVTVTCVATPGITITADGPGANVIPLEPQNNTATAGMVRLIHDVGFQGGLHVHIQKGIPIGSGLGGSAASAVAGIVAADAAMGANLSAEQKLFYALIGEAVASGDAHPDNAAPCLYGGFVFSKVLQKTGDVPRPEDLYIRHIPVPEDLEVVLIHPDVRVDTRAARAILPAAFDRNLVVAQTANLVRMVLAAYENDSRSFAQSCHDLLVEPFRKTLIPGFDLVRETALEHGAHAFNISGSGPTMFALTPAGRGQHVADACAAVYQGQHHVKTLISKLGAPGATVIA